MRRIMRIFAKSIIFVLILAGAVAAATTTYLPPYNVPGSSLAEAKTYMDLHGPQDNQGTHFPAITYIDVVPTKNQEPPIVKPIVPEPWYMATITVNVTWSIEAEILLPTWDGYANANAEAKAEWDRYVAALKEHEDGHVTVAQDTLNNMSPPAQTIFVASGTGLSPGEAIANAQADLVNVDQQIENERQNILNAIETASNQYDEDTMHGATQGATLNTNIGSGTPEEEISGLSDDLDLSSASRGIKNSLKSKLANALSSLDRGNTRAAIGQLNAFIRQLEATYDKPNGPTEEEARGMANVAIGIRNGLRGF